MSSSPNTNPHQICKNFLLKEIHDNIPPAKAVVAKRLLAREIELKSTYEELHDKLRSHPAGPETFLGLVLSTAALWNPERNLEARDARSELVTVNRQISMKAAELASLLDQRSDLHNMSGFRSGTHYQVCEVIEAASAHNNRFQSYLQRPLSDLRSRFDWKYWPSLSDFVQVLACDAERAVVVASDPLTATATAAMRPSKADFIKALFAAIEENSGGDSFHLPENLKLSDATLASLVNCALDLDPDEMIDEAYMKRFRQRERNKSK